jgi:hypothetical protein
MALKNRLTDVHNIYKRPYIAQEFWTVPEVLSEIKDSSAKEWLAFLTALNVKLRTRQPSPEAYTQGKT